jgi:hypothetical protein
MGSAKIGVTENDLFVHQTDELKNYGHASKCAAHFSLHFPTGSNLSGKFGVTTESLARKARISKLGSVDGVELKIL